jgi:hypothetical protein
VPDRPVLRLEIPSFGLFRLLVTAFVFGGHLFRPQDYRYLSCRCEKTIIQHGSFMHANSGYEYHINRSKESDNSHNSKLALSGVVFSFCLNIAKLTFNDLSHLQLLSTKLIYNSRHSYWLPAELPKGWISSPCNIKNCHFYLWSYRLWGPLSLECDWKRRVIPWD